MLVALPLFLLLDEELAPHRRFFEKMKCIFSIVPVGFLEKLWECFSPDAGVGSTGRWSRASGVVSVAQVCTGCTGVSPVLSVRCAGGLATLSAHESGEHQTLKGPNMARGGVNSLFKNLQTH